jgi:hypothetical protein
MLETEPIQWWLTAQETELISLPKLSFLWLSLSDFSSGSCKESEAVENGYFTQFGSRLDSGPSLIAFL